MSKEARLEVGQGVEPIGSAQDIIDIIRGAMEALQPEPKLLADNKQRVFNELATILDFFA
ncbi:hypothetical protein LCGC14_3065290 [marine sediment metagenome]|uniref:Uncharacterized protein n=1 Tax=marine sediment metagenome TaxID=412755 RepID=A0A0F8YQH9_9ZZZZ